LEGAGGREGETWNGKQEKKGAVKEREIEKTEEKKRVGTDFTQHVLGKASKTSFKEEKKNEGKGSVRSGFA